MSLATHMVAPEEIMALLDGELAADREETVSQHLQSCPECQSIAESLGATASALKNWTVPATPSNSGAERRLLEAAQQNASVQHSDGVAQGLAFFRRHWVATACGVFGAGLLFMMANVNLVRVQRDGGRAQTAVGGANSFVPADSNGVFQSLSEAQKSFSMNQPITDERSKMFDKARTAGQLAERVPRATGGSLGRPMTGEPIGPMIARTASLSITAKDFDTARASLDGILARRRGYAATLAVNTPQGSGRSLQASLRIPALQLTAALAELKNLGRVTGENQSGEEVTQQHADLVARLKNSRETEAQLQEILRTRTGKVSDVVAVEEEIARVRGEIEQMEAEQKSLEHRVDFATVDVTLSEEYKAQLGFPAPSISTHLHNSLIAGLRDARDTLVSIVLFFAEYGPSLMLWLLLASPLLWILRRRWQQAHAHAMSSAL